MDENEKDDSYHGWRRQGWPVFTVLKYVGIAIGGLALAVLLGFLFGYFVMLLWNWLMPALFGIKAITYWQAFGIVILAKILFGGTGGHGGYGGRHRKWKHRHWHGSDEWAPKGDYRNWRYYEDYWRAEGKAAYEAYLDKIQNKQ
jgi:hypothetical protein